MLKHCKGSESMLCSDYHYRNKTLLSEGNGTKSKEAVERHIWENFMNIKESKVRNKLLKLFSNAYTIMLLPQANTFQEYSDKAEPVMEKKIWPSLAFPGNSSSVNSIISLPVYSACLIIPYPLLHQSPVCVPSFGVHASSASCPTCRPCLSASFWSPEATCSQQCPKTGIGLWGGTKKKIRVDAEVSYLWGMEEIQVLLQLGFLSECVPFVTSW